ncbi:hypothetical protein TWF506_003377 [Arthrobotrys conoides]|uniref:Uncharacterized protein n=1 Tax=Arthrobotrys conoides TaxID=74498 RepID=A0AAN8N1V9_9PEZI
MFGHKKSKRQQQSPSQPTNQFALAAARAIVPPRSQTPTLSAAAAAAALHASPKQVTSPASLVTRRMERRGSITSITSAPPGFASPISGVGRRGSDASMTERIGWLRGADEHGTSSSSRPGSRQRPISREVVASPTKGVGKRVSIEDQRSSATTAKTLGQLESRHMPKPGKVASKSAIKGGTKPKATRELVEEEPVREVKKTSKPRKANPKPKPSPEPTHAAALVAAVAVATAGSRKSQPKAKPKPKPKPVEPVYLSESEEESEEEPPVRTYSDSESDDEEEVEEPPPPPPSTNLKKSLRNKKVEPVDDGTIHLKKSLRSTPVEAAANAPVKKKNVHAQTHSDTQGGMLSRGTMRTTVREDMEPIIDEARERQRLASKAAKTSALQDSVHAPRRQEEPPRAATGPSDAVKALALQIMREQQAKAAGKPVILESSRAKKRAAAAAAQDSDSDSDLELEPEQEPDTHIDEDEAFAAEQKEEEDRQVYKRHQYNGSVSSVTSFMSDLESIPEEAGDQSPKDGKKKKKKRPAPESVIIPGRDGVPALPSSPILEKERMRIAQVSSPEPPKNHSVERKKTLEKLTGTTTVPTAITTDDIAVEDPKGSPPSSATLTEEVTQPVVIHTIPPTPPYTVDKLHPPPRLFDAGSSDEDVKPVAKSNGAALKPKTKSSPPPRETHSPRPMKRHSPPPRSVSPAKSAMKHTQHHEGSDRSSILSAEDGSVGGHARRKAARVSFSEDPSVVEMDDDSYHYKPIHSALDKVTEKKSVTKSVGAVSFSSVSRTRVERTPSPEPSSLVAAQAAAPIEHSADHRLGGLIGAGLLGKLTKGKGKKEAGRHSPVPQKKGSYDPLAPEVRSMSPAPSISDDDLESENEAPATVEFAKAMPIVAAVATPPLAISTPPPTSASPAPVIAKPPTPEQPKEAQISAGHTPPVVEVKPIFPPPASDPATTLSENIAHGRPVVFKDDSGEDEDHFSDAYEDLDHVVLSATGSGAVIGVTAAHVNSPGIAITTEGQSAVTDTVVLPSISEVADQPVEVTTPPRSLPPQIVGRLLPEEIITDEREHVQTILSPKPIKPVSPKVISAGLTSSPSPPIVYTPPPVVKAKVANGVSKPVGTKTTKAAKAAKPRSDLAESQHAPKPKKAKATAVPAPAPVPMPVPAPVPTASRRLSKSKPTSAPAPVAAPQRRLSVSSDDSESSFQRENPHRKAARRSQGFSMRTSMRDSTGRVPPSSATSPHDSGLAASRFADTSASSRFESGFRTGRSIGTGGPRRREYSPDSSDDDRVKSLRAPAKVEKKSRFLGSSTLRNGNSAPPAGRPHSSLGFAPKGNSNTGRSGFKGFRSRFEDSSDDEDIQLAAASRARPATTYRPLTPDSSDNELPMVQTNGNKPQENGLKDSMWAPTTANGDNYAFATDISADIAPKKKWWSFGSKRKSGTGSRPVSRANSMMSAAPAPLITNLPPPPLDRRISDPDHFSSPMSTSAAQQRNQQLKKFRRLSGGSVNSIGSAKTWTPSLGTSTLVGSPSGVSSGNRNLTHGRLAELQEEDEEEHVLNNDPIDNGATNGKAQVVEPNGGVYGAPKPVKKKKFRGLRKIFGIDD